MAPESYFGRTMAQLGVQMIAAYSFKIRGSNERMFRTLQDHRPKELTLQGRLITLEPDRRTATGYHDYAILLLFARRGLRSSEIAFLELDDTDWNSGTLSVRRKDDLRNEFPLPSRGGNAITC